MLTLIETDTKKLIGKFPNDKLARLAGRMFSQEMRRCLTLVVNDAVQVPMAHFKDGEEVGYEASIEYIAPQLGYS
ncbi:MAG: hypothetical protein AB7E79_01160 [Rhodospirillaceae bacterium]